MRVITVNRGEEVLETIQATVTATGTVAAAITLIGAVQHADVSVMRRDDAQTDLLRTYDQPFELSGTGEVVDGRVHVHVTLAGEGLIVAGHLHRAVVGDFFVRVYLTPVPDQPAGVSARPAPTRPGRRPSTGGITLPAEAPNTA